MNHPSNPCSVNERMTLNLDDFILMFHIYPLFCFFCMEYRLLFISYVWMVTHMTCFFFGVCNLVPGVTTWGFAKKTDRDNSESTRNQDCPKGVSEGESHGVIPCENRIDTDILSLLVSYVHECIDLVDRQVIDKHVCIYTKYIYIYTYIYRHTYFCAYI